VITRAVGTEPSVEVETMTLPVAPGDLYLICSDGLTDIVRDEQIAELIRDAGADPDAAAEALVAAANRAGGIDNITVVLFEIVEGDPLPASEPAPVLEPDEDTMEQAAEVAVEPAGPAEPAEAAESEVPVRRHGAGAGSRWLALLAILLALAIAAVVIYWSLGR
jgi:protein phosphatase